MLLKKQGQHNQLVWALSPLTRVSHLVYTSCICSTRKRVHVRLLSAIRAGLVTSSLVIIVLSSDLSIFSYLPRLRVFWTTAVFQLCRRCTVSTPSSSRLDLQKFLTVKIGDNHLVGVWPALLHEMLTGGMQLVAWVDSVCWHRSMTPFTAALQFGRNLLQTEPRWYWIWRALNGIKLPRFWEKKTTPISHGFSVGDIWGV